ncbi:MAG: GNAT family N-acetyltransferase [Clostridiales bacterium]|nr:GNAT family N-acetyltransferase [Clostridiales bacterium]
MDFRRSAPADLPRLAAFYRDVTERTPGMDIYCRWIWGLHPSEEMISAYIDTGAMYTLEEDGVLLAAVAVTRGQGEDYHSVEWSIDLPDDAVAVVHILCVDPSRQKQQLGKAAMRQVLDLARREGRKAVRLDALYSNTPAQHMYEKMGFRKRGVRNWYVPNIGYTDFFLYEYCL